MLAAAQMWLLVVQVYFQDIRQLTSGVRKAGAVHGIQDRRSINFKIGLEDLLSVDLRSLREYLYEVRWPLFIGIIAFAHHLGSDDMRGDTIHYALIAKQLLHSDNWMVLYSCDEIYLNKPPLFFWLTALAMKLCGVNAVGAQLISVLFGIALTVLIYQLGCALAQDKQVGLVAALVFVSSRVILRNTEAVRLESMLTFLMLLALVCFLRYLPRRQGLWLTLSFLMTGLAVLTKGFAGLAPLGAILLYLISYERDLLDRRLLQQTGWGLLVFLLSCGWWFAYAISNTAFLHSFMDDQITQAIWGEPSPVHGRHLYLKYFGALLVNYFYYVPFCLIGAYYLWREHRGRPGVRLFGLFALLNFLVMLGLTNKYVRYTYPLFALAALPTALALVRCCQINWLKWVPAIAVMMAMLLVIMPGPLGMEAYVGLREVGKLARHNHVPILMSDGYRSGWGYKAAQFYLDGRFLMQAPTKGAYIEVIEREAPTDTAKILLFKKGRVWAYYRHPCIHLCS